MIVHGEVKNLARFHRKDLVWLKVINSTQKLEFIACVMNPDFERHAMQAALQHHAHVFEFLPCSTQQHDVVTVWEVKTELPYVHNALLDFPKAAGFNVESTDGVRVAVTRADSQMARCLAELQIFIIV